MAQGCTSSFKEGESWVHEVANLSVHNFYDLYAQGAYISYSEPQACRYLP